MNEFGDFALCTLEEVLPWICIRNTSSDPAGWHKRCAVWGHSDVIALVVQRIFGGELRHAELLDAPATRTLRDHYWNVLDDYRTDLAAAEFTDCQPCLVGSPYERADLLQVASVTARYHTVWQRLNTIMGQSVPAERPSPNPRTEQ